MYCQLELEQHKKTPYNEDCSICFWTNNTCGSENVSMSFSTPFFLSNIQTKVRLFIMFQNSEMQYISTNKIMDLLFTVVELLKEFSQAVGIKVARRRGPIPTLLHPCLHTRHP
jgi:hypothetical protein